MIILHFKTRTVHCKIVGEVKCDITRCFHRYTHFQQLVMQFQHLYMYELQKPTAYELFGVYRLSVLMNYSVFTEMCVTETLVTFPGDIVVYIYIAYTVQYSTIEYTDLLLLWSCSCGHCHNCTANHMTVWSPSLHSTGGHYNH